MTKLFVHHPLFRLLSPVISGIMVYLLILLINNNVNQLQEQFLGQELYLCIGLSYIIQEISRALLLLFEKLPSFKSLIANIGLQVIVSMSLCVLIVTFSIVYYFEKVLGYTANNEELLMFNSIFSSITLVYILLNISHYYLYKINTQKLESELLIKQNLEADFKQFKREINPNLLFESLETLLILMQKNKDKTDDFIDHLAMVYRYILSGKENELVSVKEEIKALDNLVQLLNYLPFRNVSVTNKLESDFLIVPGCLLFIFEQIVRKTISSSNSLLKIHILEHEGNFTIEYQSNDSLTNAFDQNDLMDIKKAYGFYSVNKIDVTVESDKRIIRIPQLIAQTEPHI